ncbi:MOFRL family protein [Paraglaciecola aquimarina]|uniref:MOFRL family protein n=1 Tax=Paraglaciecola aquimarina TaxID=1235557 RepID=A0ABU3SWG1_9ALTE|nr:MOFRL family protein [Paraglaciecola aquimarina]MDU0354323.1 MOFRL family protein [Paraglaciecola aquimarina]
MCLPVEGISFEDKLAVHKFLLRSGASIDEMNVVRKQLSQVKGGGLALASKSDFYTYVISDVVGDDPSIIASGPTVVDKSTASQALDILEKYEWTVNAAIAQTLQSAQAVQTYDSLKSEYAIVANANTAIDSAIDYAQKQGWQTQVLNYEQQGEAAEVARQHAVIAKSLQKEGKRLLLFSGGELTVSVKNATGQGGPNQEYALAMANALEGQPGISVLSCDTDGVDGSKDVAGAFVDADTLARAKQLKLDPSEYLTNHDSFHFFEALGDLIITGPTQTNVNDFRVIMINCL